MTSNPDVLHSIPTVPGKKIWDMRRAGARERQEGLSPHTFSLHITRRNTKTFAEGRREVTEAGVSHGGRDFAYVHFTGLEHAQGLFHPEPADVTEHRSLKEVSETSLELEIIQAHPAGQPNEAVNAGTTRL